MKHQVGFGCSRSPDFSEQGFLAGQGCSDHMNLRFRQSLGEFENAVRPLQVLDIADPQRVDITGGDRRRLFHQHSRHATRQPVAARQSFCLRSALHENGIGAPQALRIKPTIARNGYDQADAGLVTVRITRGAEYESPAKTTTE